MTLDEFLLITETRIPSVSELTSLCDELGIRFAVKEGTPRLVCPDAVEQEAILIAKLFKREPFRTMVIQERLSQEAATETPKQEPAKEQTTESDNEPDTEEPEKFSLPDGARLIVADADSRTGNSMKGPPHMWTYDGAPRWYYVASNPIPAIG